MVEASTKKRQFTKRNPRHNMHKIPVLSKLDEEGKIITFLMLNLCDDGAYFLTKKDLAIGSKVSIQFALPYHQLALLADKKLSVSVKAKVVRKNSAKEPVGIGVSFDSAYKVTYKPRF
ncbi:MAG: hypothetical protein GQ542_20030 [Desulforhopalus sp.]|nr:hypothetical protein [Desulforhopalus sp.]